MTKRFVLLFFAMLLGIASCVPLTPEAQTTRSTLPTPTQLSGQGNCIPPVTEFEFPVREERAAVEAKIVVPLPIEWKIQTHLPEDSHRATLELIEHQPGFDIIWVRLRDYSRTNPENKFFRYRTDTKQWSSISFKSDGNEVIPSNLFQDQNGSVWGLQYTSQSTLPLILRLKDDEGNFEFISDVGDELTTEWRSDTAPIVDEEGNFWLILKNNKLNKMVLFSFDPRTLKATSHISGKEYEFGGSIAIAQDGSIFLLRPKEKELVQYFPNTDKSRVINLNDAIEGKLTEYGYPILFFDHSGRIWMSDFGWLDLTTGDYPAWHQIIRSPLFIIKNESPLYTYVWARPYPMLEEPDGRLLFKNGGGLTWLDPGTGIWCKFTSIDTNVLTDQNGDLWLLDKNKLYRYSVTP